MTTILLQLGGGHYTEVYDCFMVSHSKAAPKDRYPENVWPLNEVAIARRISDMVAIATEAPLRKIHYLFSPPKLHHVVIQTEKLVPESKAYTVSELAHELEFIPSRWKFQIRWQSGLPEEKMQFYAVKNPSVSILFKAAKCIDRGICDNKSRNAFLAEHEVYPLDEFLKSHPSED